MAAGDRLAAIRGSAARQAAARSGPTTIRPAPKRAGDDMGRIAMGPGVPREVAIELAKGKPWWPRVRSRVPHGSRGWWCWPLKPAVDR